MRRLIAVVLSLLVLNTTLVADARAWEWRKSSRYQSSGGGVMQPAPVTAPADCEEYCRPYNDADQRRRCQAGCQPPRAGGGPDYTAGHSQTPGHRKWLIGIWLAVIAGVGVSLAASRANRK